MVTRNQIVMLKVLFVVGGSIGGFALCQHWYRTLEARASVAIVHHLAGRNSASVAGVPTMISVRPLHGPGFFAVITPSCSATASILAIACLASLSPRFGATRRLVGTVAALVAVAL